MAITLAPHRNGFDAPAVFGSRDEIKAVADRMRIMLPSARLQDWQLGDKYRAAAERNLEESLYRAAQLCVFYRLVPGEDVHLIPFNNGWAVDMGIETWKKAADRYCAQHGITYHLHTVDMPVDELKERRGENYDPDDAGVIAYLWRSDKAQVYQIFGAESAMTKGYGIWAKKARWNKKDNKWDADTIPAQRAKQDVARRRAMKMALRAEFSLDSLLAANPAEVQSNLRSLEQSIRNVEMDHALPAPRRYDVDEDGIYAVETPRQPQPQPEPEDGDFADADLEHLFDDDAPAEAATPDAAPDYAVMAEKLTGNAHTLAKWAKGIHLNSDGPASEKQYNFLAGTLDALTGVQGSHNRILGVFVGHAVDKTNPPGARLAKLLLDYLLKERKTEVGGKEPNPNYRQDVADSIVAIWNTVA